MEILVKSLTPLNKNKKKVEGRNYPRLYKYLNANISMNSFY